MESEIKTIPHTRASKTMKRLEITSPKEEKDFCSETWKVLLKEMSKKKTKWEGLSWL